MTVRSLSLVVVILLVGLGAARADDLPWKQFESREGRFVVEFPGTPRPLSSPRPTAKWGTLEQHLFAVELPSNLVFSVSYIDYPKGAIDKDKIEQLLDDARATVVKLAKGKLISETKVTMNGFPGRVIVFEGANNLVFIAHYYLVNGRLYTALVYGPKAAPDSPPVARFFDSFKIKT
jgi:hypothetical protein